MSDITIVNYGSGNLSSIARRLQALKFDVCITDDPTEVRLARRLILPGVGAFDSAMRQLRQSGMLQALRDASLERRVPTLGICLGMQLLAAASEEGAAQEAGLGWFNARVVRLPVRDTARFKVPHVGWNTVTPLQPHPLTEGLDAAAAFYFVHAFCWSGHGPADTLATTTYDVEFPSVVGRDMLLGVQFHPEKSYAAGDRLLQNFGGL